MLQTAHRIRIGLAAAALFFAAGLPAGACPLCSEETEARAEETGVNASMGYSVSVLLMIALPMTMVGGLGYALYRQQQHTAAQGAAERPPR